MKRHGEMIKGREREGDVRLCICIKMPEGERKGSE